MMPNANYANGGQWLTNPQAVGNAIAIKGPPGTGKTTWLNMVLVKS